MKPFPPVILLDLDGTLTDPKEGIERCLRYALATLGVSIPVDLDFAQYIGPPLRDSLRHLLGTSHEETVVAAVSLYRQRFAAKGMFENRLYPGIRELLKGIQDTGWRAYVVTSKPQPYADQIVHHFGLADFFVAVYGSHLNGQLAHKAELLAHVLKHESITPACAVMVGDRLHDIHAARCEAVDSIGVTYGYGSREELEAAGATWICDDTETVLRVLCTRFAEQIC